MFRSRASSEASQDNHTTDGRATKIRTLNDDFRTRLPRPISGCKLIITDGVNSLPPNHFAELLLAVRSFSDFNDDNDPHGEHDFGSIEHNGQRCFWKIDYYDQWMQFASPDASDPAVTTRALTIMLASEY